MSASKCSAWIRFLRLPAVFTVPGDVWVGAAAAGTGCSFQVTAAVCMAYLFGMGFNDVADLQRDRKLRPERPLPKGEIRPAAAIGVCILLAAAALALLPGLPMGGLLTVIVLYTLLKDFFPLLGAVLMALCRILALWIGAGAPGVLGAVLWPLLLIWGVLIFMITLLADTETRKVQWVFPAASLLTLLWLAAPLMALWVSGFDWWLLLPWGVLFGLGMQNLQSIRTAGRLLPPHTGRWLSMLIPLQGLFLLAWAPLWQGAVVLGFYPCLRWAVRRMQIS